MYSKYVGYLSTVAFSSALMEDKFSIQLPAKVQLFDCIRDQDSYKESLFLD
jgi:hypothetical protein